MDIHGNRNLCNCLPASREQAYPADVPTTYTLWPTTAEQKLRQGREIEVAPPAKARVAATHRHSVVAYQHPVELAHWLVCPPHAPYGPRLQSNSSARAGRSRWHCQLPRAGPSGCRSSGPSTSAPQGTPCTSTRTFLPLRTLNPTRMSTSTSTIGAPSYYIKPRLTD